MMMTSGTRAMYVLACMCTYAFMHACGWQASGLADMLRPPRLPGVGKLLEVVEKVSYPQLYMADDSQVSDDDDVRERPSQ